MTLRSRRYLGESLDPSSMSMQEFWKRIERADAGKYSKSFEVDWGSSRGAGKRIGRMVTGGMSDPPRGKRGYVDLLAKMRLSGDDKEEAGNLTELQKQWFARAMAAGFSTDVAFLVAYAVPDRGYAPTGRAETYRLAVEQQR